ncbi:hypothetical protein Csa_004668 [Cucumis sativus]|nr:hypothetical protein Csa_004668 [Cucumis sativus]
MDDGCSESESARGTRGSSKGSQRRYSPRTHNLFWIHPPVAAAVIMPNLRIAWWIFHEIVDG